MGTADDGLRSYMEMLLAVKRKMALPKGFTYHGAEDYVLERGVWLRSEPLTADELAVVGRIIQRHNRPFHVKQCFHNAQMLASLDTSGTLRYCEGYGVHIIPTLHAWVTINDKVVDLTWRTDEQVDDYPLPDRVFGTIPAGWSYCGVHMDRKDVLARMFDRRETASFLDDWGRGHPLFRQPRLECA